MNNYYGIIYENANLDNLERQLLSGYITESKLVEMISEDKFNHSELDMIYKYKPQVFEIVAEWNPVGIGSRLKTWAMGKVPRNSFKSSAQGRKQFAQQANKLKADFHRYLGSIGKKLSVATNNDLAGFLQQQRIDISKSPKISQILGNLTDLVDDSSVNEVIKLAIQMKNSAPVYNPPNVPQANNSPSSPNTQLSQQEIMAIGDAFNKVFNTNKYGYAMAKGLINKLAAAGIKISI